MALARRVAADESLYAQAVVLARAYLALAEENERLLGLLSVYQHAWANDNRVPMDTAKQAKPIAEAYRARIQAALRPESGA